MKEKCQKCGRIVKLGSGIWTSWGGKYPQGIFLCMRCVRRLEKEEALEKLEKFKEIADFAKSIPSPKEKENEAMTQVLRELCKVDGWYRLVDITQSFKRQISWGLGVREVSMILSRLGFTERRRMGGGYTNVWISLTILQGR